MTEKRTLAVDFYFQYLIEEKQTFTAITQKCKIVHEQELEQKIKHIRILIRIPNAPKLRYLVKALFFSFTPI